MYLVRDTQTLLGLLSLHYTNAQVPKKASLTRMPPVRLYDVFKKPEKPPSEWRKISHSRQIHHGWNSTLTVLRQEICQLQSTLSELPVEAVKTEHERMVNFIVSLPQEELPNAQEVARDDIKYCTHLILAEDRTTPLDAELRSGYAALIATKAACQSVLRHLVQTDMEDLQVLDKAAVVQKAVYEMSSGPYKLLAWTMKMSSESFKKPSKRWKASRQNLPRL